MGLEQNIKYITPPTEQKRGVSFMGQRDWEKQWGNIFRTVDRVTKRSCTDTLTDLTPEATQALVDHIDPWDNYPDSLANALINLLEVNKPKALVSAICPPYSLPGQDVNELAAETGKTLTSFDPENIALGMTNLGTLIRSLTQEPVDLNILSLTSLGDGHWTNLVINPAVSKTYGPYAQQTINSILDENTNLVGYTASQILSEFDIQLNIYSLDSTLWNTESLMTNLGFTDEHLNQLKALGTQYSPGVIEKIAELIPENIRARYFSHDRESSISWAWKSFGADSALFNFFFYLQLGQTVASFPVTNNGSIISLPLEIDAYGQDLASFFTFSTGWHNTHYSGAEAPPYWGIRNIPVMVPRPVIHVDPNGKVTQNQSGIRQRW